jgi:phage/plasmid-associated DNA primase
MEMRKLYHALGINKVAELFDIASGNRLVCNYKKAKELKVEGREDINIPIKPDYEKGIYAPDEYYLDNIDENAMIKILETYSILRDNVAHYPLQKTYLDSITKQEEIRQKYQDESKHFQVISNDQAKKILDVLDGEYVDNGCLWRNICLFMCNLGVDKQVVIDWSQNSEKWDYSSETYINDKWENFNPDSPWGQCERFPRGFGMPYIKSRLKLALEGAENMKEFCADNNITDVKYANYFVKGDEGCKLLAKILLQRTVKITKADGKHGKDPLLGYRWNESMKVWQSMTERQMIEFVVCQTLMPLLNKTINDLIDSIRHEQEDDESDDETKSKKNKKNKNKSDVMDVLNKRKTQLQSNTYVCQCFKACCRVLEDINFEQKINLTIDPVLPIKGGLLYNMETGTITERKISDLWSFELNVEIVKDIQKAEVYLREVCKNIEKDYLILRKVLGYCLSTSKTLKKVFNFIGDRDSGKSTLIEFLQLIFSKTFVKIMAENAIMDDTKSSSRSSHQDEEKHAIQGGARLACVTDTDSNRKWKEGTIKRNVGERDQIVRSCHGNTETISSNTKLMALSNNIIEISGGEHFTKKIFFFEFRNQFEKSKDNIQKIEQRKKDQEFLNQLFSLIMIGSKEFYTDHEIEEQEGVWNKYIEKSDPIKSWISENCEKGDGTDMTFRLGLEEAYNNFLNNTGVIKMKKDFRNEMTNNNGFECKKNRHYIYTFDVNRQETNNLCFMGIRLKIHNNTEKDDR